MGAAGRTRENVREDRHVSPGWEHTRDQISMGYAIDVSRQSQPGMPRGCCSRGGLDVGAAGTQPSHRCQCGHPQPRAATGPAKPQPVALRYPHGTNFPTRCNLASLGPKERWAGGQAHAWVSPQEERRRRDCCPQWGLAHPAELPQEGPFGTAEADEVPSLLQGTECCPGPPGRSPSTDPHPFSVEFQKRRNLILKIIFSKKRRTQYRICNLWIPYRTTVQFWGPSMAKYDNLKTYLNADLRLENN